MSALFPVPTIIKQVLSARVRHSRVTGSSDRGRRPAVEWRTEGRREGRLRHAGRFLLAAHCLKDLEA